MFRGDFEFHDGAAASHLGHGKAPAPQPAVPEPMVAPAPAANDAIAVPTWAGDAQKELQKIPFFVRGKARRNTERFATERGLATITVETLYDAKAHFGR
jgi:light-independent protochlorophyllide reductase subunit B